jgi:hypothetical protein
MLGVFILFFGGCAAFLVVVGKSLDSGKPTVLSNGGGTNPPDGNRGPNFPGKQKNDTAANAGRTRRKVRTYARAAQGRCHCGQPSLPIVVLVT